MSAETKQPTTGNTSRELNRVVAGAGTADIRTDEQPQSQRLEKAIFERNEYWLNVFAQNLRNDPQGGRGVKLEPILIYPYCDTRTLPSPVTSCTFSIHVKYSEFRLDENRWSHGRQIRTHTVFHVKDDNVYYCAPPDGTQEQLNTRTLRGNMAMAADLMYKKTFLILGGVLSNERPQLGQKFNGIAPDHTQFLYGQINDQLQETLKLFRDHCGKVPGLNRYSFSGVCLKPNQYGTIPVSLYGQDAWGGGTKTRHYHLDQVNVGDNVQGAVDSIFEDALKSMNPDLVVEFRRLISEAAQAQPPAGGAAPAAAR